MQECNPVDMTACAEICLECSRVCTETISKLLSANYVVRDTEYIQRIIDCMVMCQTSANFLLRGSKLAHRVCQTCSVTCKLCAEQCDRLEDPILQRCAAECSGCAESCRSMSG